MHTHRLQTLNEEFESAMRTQMEILDGEADSRQALDEDYPLDMQSLMINTNYRLVQEREKTFKSSLVALLIKFKCQVGVFLTMQDVIKLQ